jgi:putative phage-type endonuclease
MNEQELIQGSAEWLAARVGSLGASRVHDVVAKTKSGYAASRGNVMAELLVERLTGKQYERYVSKEMAFGTETEPHARAAYEWAADVDVKTCGIFRHPTIHGTHASPDGLIGDDALIEIKVPNSSSHLETLLGAPIAARYVTQMQWQMACTNRQWCDFVSFDPNMPADLQLVIRRVERDDKMIEQIEAEVRAFLAELDEKILQLKQLTKLEHAA